jgi:uncharacterized protein
MSRLLFIVAIIAIVYQLTRSFRAGKVTKHEPEREEDMVRCTYCGVHLPKNEALMVDGDYYCNETHRHAFQAGRDNPNAG